jgi:magnesium-transporting ATPase (P-type)
LFLFIPRSFFFPFFFPFFLSSIDFHYRCKASPTFRDITLKDAQSLYLNIRGSEFVFDLLFPIDYTSKRARMSVVVRDPRDGSLRVFIKGLVGVMMIIESK